LRITEEILEKMEEYKGKPPSTSKEWLPFTKDELLLKIGDREYDEIRVIGGNLGSELDVFKNERWLFSILKYQGLYYVRKVDLPYEKYMAFVTATRFPLVISGILIGWFWKHNIERYGLLRTIAMVFVPIFIWWASGLIPIIILSYKSFLDLTFLVVIVTLYLGFLAAYIVASFSGLLLGILIFISLIMLYKKVIYVSEGNEDVSEEFDFIEEKILSLT